MKSPFPYFGGKSRIAADVWARFGPVANYVEPFFGSGAVLLNRPDAPGIETINDKDHFVANFWRAVSADPEAVAFHADNPVNETDLTARHLWLVSEGVRIIGRCQGEPDFYDAKVAGWWAWGLCCWIGSGWCSGEGPWTFHDGEWVNRKRPHLGDAGQGVNRKRPHLGDAGHGVNRQLPHLGNAGHGVRRKLPHLGDGRGSSLVPYMQSLADRLRNVRVCCGDWARICGPSPTFTHGMTGVFLDPPYSDEADRAEVYRTEDLTVAHRVREWAIEAGKNPLMRVALCGYDTEHAMPPDWEVCAWKAAGGYGNQGDETRGRDNASREVVWFSPACLPPVMQDLFATSTTNT